MEHEDKEHLGAEVAEATREIKAALVSEYTGDDVDENAVEDGWGQLLEKSSEDEREQLDERLQRELLSVKADLLSQVEGLHEQQEQDEPTQGEGEQGSTKVTSQICVHSC